MATLFTDLSLEDSAIIVKDLERQNVPYELRSLSSELVAESPSLAFFRGTPALGFAEAIGRAVREQAGVPDLWLLFAPLKKDRTDFLVEEAVDGREDVSGGCGAVAVGKALGDGADGVCLVPDGLDGAAFGFVQIAISCSLIGWP